MRQDQDQDRDRDRDRDRHLPLHQLRTLVAASPTAGWPDVRVAAIWLPHLPLRVEVLRRPALDGHPLVLGGGPGERKVVRLCSPEAERAGVRPGLPLREVLPLCPEAVILQPDPVRVAGVLDDVVTGLQQVAAAVEATPEGEGNLFLDLRGLERVYGRSLDALVRAIRDAVPPLLRPRLAFAGGKFAAAVAARVTHASGPPRVVPARQTAAFLAPLPAAFLPLGPDTLVRLDYLGLRTIGDLARLPFAAVQAQFGPDGARAWRLAHGQDAEPVIARRAVEVVRASLRFEDPLASTDAIMVALDDLLARVFAAPALAGAAARQARLRALLADGSSWEQLFTFKEALTTREAAKRALRAKLDLPGGLPPAPVDEMLLDLLGLGGESARQGSLFVAHARQLAPIAEAGRQLRARYGGRLPLYHAVEVEPWSRIPERRWALVTYDL